MKKTKDNIHIFDNCDQIFDSLLDSFVQKYSTLKITTGKGQRGDTFHHYLNELFNSEMKEGAVKIFCKKNNSIYTSSIIFKARSFFSQGVYMVHQNFFWESSNKYAYSIWKLKDLHPNKYIWHWDAGEDEQGKFIEKKL